MPFTVSHAAAVLPLRRLGNGRLPLAALMIGSMSPDFSYFLPGDLSVLPTHTFTGLFWFCLPAGLAIWMSYVQLLEGPTLALLPGTWRVRINPSDSRITFATIAFACLAIVIGAATHVIWDSFTHRWTPVVQALPFMRISLFKIGYSHIYVYRFLQHLSSLVGMVLLLIWAWRIRHAEPVLEPTGWAANGATLRTRLAAAIILIATSGVFAIGNYMGHSGVYFERRLYHFAIGGMAGWVLAWCVVAVAMRWARKSAT
ncbi:MAG: DUF4184 family protein [Pseudomonadota bacterium]